VKWFQGYNAKVQWYNSVANYLRNPPTVAHRKPCTKQICTSTQTLHFLLCNTQPHKSMCLILQHLDKYI